LRIARLRSATDRPFPSTSAKRQHDQRDADDEQHEDDADEADHRDR
jgi:hypothetical protein